MVGIFVTQAPEFGKALGAPIALSAGKGVMFTYLGISLGDIFAGLLAQLSKSRKLAVFIFQILILISSVLYLSNEGISTVAFNWLAFFMGMIFLLTAIAIFALTQLKESFNRDLDFVETTS